MKTVSLQKSQQRFAWILLTPALIVFGLVALYPLVHTFYLSLTNAHAFRGTPAQWVGLANYRTLLSDGLFYTSLKNTLVFTVCTVTLEMALGLAAALLLNREFKGRTMARAALLVPWAIPTVVSARIWSWILNDVFGVANDLLVHRLGLLDQPIAWLARDGFAMASAIFVDVWKTTPFVALLLLAGLQVIPEELNEAAEVDGANPIQRFFAVTLPLLKPIIVVALIFRTMDALRIFDMIWILTTGQFGTETIGTYNYRNLMDYGQLGYGSTISVAIFLLLGVFIVVYTMFLPVEEEQQ